MSDTFLDKLIEQRDALEESLDSLYSTCEQRTADGGDLALTEAEEANAVEMRAQIDALNARIEVTEADLERRRKYSPRNVGQQVRGVPNWETTTTTSVGGAVVRAEEAVYKRSKLDDPQEPSFLRDVLRKTGTWIGKERLADDGYDSRLERHVRQVREQYHLRDDTGIPLPVFDRAISATTTANYSNSSNIGSLVPTDYRPDLYAPGLYGGRITADLCARFPLPARGMTVSFPRVTTEASAGIQATQGSEVSSAGVATTETVLNISTIASGINVSRQAIERGEMVESLIFAEMISAYGEDLDNQVIEGTGSSGQLKGIFPSTASGNLVTLNNTGSASPWTAPTTAAWWGALVKLPTVVATARQRSIDVIVMHPRRWGYLLDLLDSQNRPLFNPAATARNVMGIGTLATGDMSMISVVGNIAGIDVVLDANIPTDINKGSKGNSANQDIILGFRRADQFLFEQAGPLMVRANDTLATNLQVQLVIYGYAAFTAERYSACGAIQGSGLGLTL